MAETMTIAKVLSVIREAGEKQTQELRFVRTVELGDQIRQGDIALYPIATPSAALRKKFTRWPLADQLALGNTQGSRHCFAAGGGVKLWRYDIEHLLPSEVVVTGDLTGLLGPLVEIPERDVLTHPEHAHVSLPAGWYRCLYQADERTQMRVQD